MYVQPLEGSISPNALASPAGNAAQEGALLQGAAAPTTGDNISRFVPPGLNGGADDSGTVYGGSGSLQGIFGSLMGVLEQLMQTLQSLMGYGCNAPYGSGGSSSRMVRAAAIRHPDRVGARRTETSVTFRTQAGRARAIRTSASTAPNGIT